MLVLLRWMKFAISCRIYLILKGTAYLGFDHSVFVWAKRRLVKEIAKKVTPGVEILIWTLTQVFWICVGLLEMAYGVAILMGATSTSLWSKTATVCATAFSYCSALGDEIYDCLIINWSELLLRESKAGSTLLYKKRRLQALPFLHDSYMMIWHQLRPNLFSKSYPSLFYVPMEI